MSEKMYLVTGAAGHVGNVLIGKLVRRGERVRGLLLPGDRSVNFNGKIEIVYGDVCDAASLEAFFDNPHGYELIVLHTAGVVSIASRYQQKVYDVNVQGTKNIVDLCIRHRVARLVHVSSVHAIPIPGDGGRITEVSSFSPDSVNGLYAKTKAEATQYVLDQAAAGLNASVVQPTGILGPGDHGHGHLTQMVIDYLNGGLTACVRGGYDFVDVRDVACGILSCAARGRAGECYILSGHFCAVPDLLNMLHGVSGKRAIRTVLPYWFARASAPLAEAYYKVLGRPPLYTAYSMETLREKADFSCGKAANELRYHARPLIDTLRDETEWLLNHGMLKPKAARAMRERLSSTVKGAGPLEAPVQ